MSAASAVSENMKITAVQWLCAAELS